MLRWLGSIPRRQGVIIGVLALCGVAAADTIYVPGDHDTIQVALDAAMSGDEVCVAPGTYHEAIDFLGKAVRLYSTGGPHVTTIDATGLAASVVQCVTGEGPDTVLDGFTITGGTGTWRAEPWPGRYGGGMLNVDSGPTVSNCTFAGNSVDWCGGGMANDGSSPLVTDCSFIANQAYDCGGGMANDRSSPTVTNCSFIDNAARDGGGMSNWYESSPTVTGCSFDDNRADNRGGGLSNWYASDTIATSCTFARNTAGNRAGGMYNGFSQPTVTDCAFTGNVSDGRGGGMYNYESDSTLRHCTFTANAARFNRGGGIYNFYSGPTITSCAFTDNSADSDRGGAMCNNHGAPAVINCTFYDNYGSQGGAIYESRSGSTLMNCTFIENVATGRGGAMFAFAAEPTATNCSFLANIAVHGGTLACDTPEWERPSAVRLANCILWNGGDEIDNRDDSTLVMSYCDVQGGYPGYANIELDPLCDAAGRLRPGSPCIDAGANNAVPGDGLDLDGNGLVLERVPIDLDGNPRFMDDVDAPNTGCGSTVVDIGACEFAGVPAPPLPIGDVDGDGSVGFDDMLDLLNAWGACEAECCPADVDFSWTVDFEDLLLVLGTWSER